MKVILLGLFSLIFNADAFDFGDYNGVFNTRHSDRKICHYVDGGESRQIHCKECCGPLGNQTCCEYDDSKDSDDSDDHDWKHDKDHHHKVKVVVVMGSLAVVVFTIVIIGCCVFHKKYKGQQSQKKTAVLNDVIDIPASIMHPVNTKSSLPADDLYTGQNLTTNNKTKDIAVVGMMMSSPPPYNTKY